MRWLYHVVMGAARDVTARLASSDRYAPESLAKEGFIHASFRDDVRESARLYFPSGATLSILTIDPRRLDVPLDIANTPRGPMPHIVGSIPRAAIAAPIAIESFDESKLADHIDP